jgi:hypothetical protein
MAQGFTRANLNTITKDGTTISGGTATRILYAGAGPVVTDSANLIFDGTDFLLGSGIRARMVGQNRIRYLNSMAKVWKSADQVIATGTSTIVTFNTEAFDTDALHDTVTNNSRITVAIAGKYLVGAEVQWEASALGTYRQGAIYKNGSIVTVLGTIGPTSGGTPVQTSSMILSLAATDYVEISVVHDAGVNQNILGTGEADTSFWVAYIGE